MNPSLFRKLKKWRDETAKKEMVEGFRVIPNRAIEDVAILEPKTREELTNIKGIKDKKYYKYGKEIIDIVKSESKKTQKEKDQPFFMPTRRSDRKIIIPQTEDSFYEKTSPFVQDDNNKIEKTDKIYSVSEFLDRLNEKLMSDEMRVKGEITSVDEREKVIYFSLKDKEDESVVNCLMFRYQYEISDIKLEIGNEIIANGIPEIYKPTGRLSLKVNLIEIAGQGALKKAYDKLKEKFEKEGLFELERKKQLPELPQTIALITSSQGAAIGDFTTNLGNYGFKIKFINSSVEGKKAIFDLIKAIKQVKRMKNLDVLVIVRGGGSLESLQAFNNEKLVREIITLKIPIICGIGHEKDISLISLVADSAVSTPTAAARIVRDSWDRAVEKLSYDESIIINSFERHLYKSKQKIETLSFHLSQKFENILQKFSDIKNDFVNTLDNIKYSIEGLKDKINNYKKLILSNYNQAVYNAKDKIINFENIININNPERQLKLGYSIVSLEGNIVKSIEQIKKGDTLDIKISDGNIKTEVKDI